MDSGFDEYARMARCSALADGAGVRRALEALGEPPERIAAVLRRHHVAEPAIRALRDDGGSSASADELDRALGRMRRRLPLAADALPPAFGEAQDALAAAGVPVLMLKGVVIAQRLYGGPSRRTQHDLDLLVRRGELRRARRALGALGYRKRSRDQHGLNLWRGALEIDLHWALRSAPGYRIDEDAVWRNARPLSAGGLSTRTLGDDHLLTLLAVSAVEDAGLGMVKLKQLCDLWLLARELDAGYDWERWLHRREEERLDGLAMNGCALALAALDGCDDAPNLSEELQRRASSVRVRDREHALRLAFAPRDAETSMAWFAEVYPGSLAAYRMHAFVARLPGSVRDVRVGRALSRLLRYR